MGPRCMLCISALCSEHEAQMLLPDSVEYLKDRVFDSPPSGPFPFWASDAVQASARPVLCTFSCKGELSHCKLREIASCAVGQSCASKDVMLHVLLEPLKRLRAQYWACFRAVFVFRPCPSFSPDATGFWFPVRKLSARWAAVAALYSGTVVWLISSFLK